jgi:DNA-binding beta-propeller fold protein YncE
MNEPSPLDSTHTLAAPAPTPTPPAGRETVAVDATAPSSAPPTPAVPGYEFVRELGRGGMGVVYLARHLKLNRHLALKMVLAGGHASPAALARFRTEIGAVAKLSHPGILRVFEAGEAGGLPFCSLEYCPGGSLADRLKDGPLPPAEAAKVVRQLAQAVQHAHANNIVHRDLKPANVLIAEDGTLKVADFGLARNTDSDGGTGTGQAMGTAAYMAPEQWTDARRAGPAADVWALGVILYECLSGTVPFGKDFSPGTMARVLNDDPPALGAGDLETICRKCLAKEPAGRFASAEALAEELRRYLDGEPLTVRPVGPSERAVKWVRRNPAVSALMAAVAFVLVAGAAVATGFGLHAAEQARLATLARGEALDEKRKADDRAEGERQAREAAEEAERKATERERDANTARLEAKAEAENARKAEAEANKQLTRAETARYAITMDLALRAWEQKDLARMRDLMDGTNWSVRGWEYDHLRDLERRTAMSLKGHTHGVTSVAWSPDGKRVATASWDHTASVWDAATGQETLTLKGHTGFVTSVAWSPDGKRVATASSDNTARVWDAATGQELAGEKP